MRMRACPGATACRRGHGVWRASAELGEEGASSSEAAGLGSNVTASDSGSSEAPAAVEKRKPVVEKTDFFGDDDGDEEEGLFS